MLFTPKNVIMKQAAIRNQPKIISAGFIELFEIKYKCVLNSGMQAILNIPDIVYLVYPMKKSR